MGKGAGEDDTGVTDDLVAAMKRLPAAPQRFGFGVKDAKTSLLVLHRTKSGAALGKTLKADAGCKKTTHGMASAEDGVLVLELEGPKVPGLARLVKILLRREKITKYAKVRVLCGGVEEPEEGDGPAAPPDSPAEAIAQAKPATAPAPPRCAVTPAENERLSTLNTEALRKENLTQRDPKELFTESYMEGLVGLKVKGANEPKLKDVMRLLAKGASGAPRKELIGQLAAIRGVPAARLDADYGRFLVLRVQQEAIRRTKKDMEPVPDVMEMAHDAFSGSNPQLVFGKVVGDAFGIDPVFGALLSPTGGMVGPGNAAVHLDDDDPTGYHGIVHDAAGYLFNYHDQGPGYNYLGKEARDTADPMTGQQSGMRYWHEKLDPGASTKVLNGVIDVVYLHLDAAAGVKKGATAAKDAVVATAEQVKVEAEKKLESARTTVNNAIDAAMKAAADKKKAAATALEKAAQEAAAAARAAKDALERTAVQTVGSAREAVGNLTDSAAAKMDAVWNFVWS